MIYGTIQNYASNVSAEYGWPVKTFEWIFKLNDVVKRTKPFQRNSVISSTSDAQRKQKQKLKRLAWIRESFGRASAKTEEMNIREMPTTKYELKESKESSKLITPPYATLNALRYDIY